MLAPSAGDGDRGASRRDRDALKEVVVGGVSRGRSVADVDDARARSSPQTCSSELAAPRHARAGCAGTSAGHRTVLVSASLRAYLGRWPRRSGIDDVLCTDVVADRRRSVHATASRRQLPRPRRSGAGCDAWLERTDSASAELWAYGDSRGDRELLDRADHPVWVDGATVLAVARGPVADDRRRAPATRRGRSSGSRTCSCSPRPEQPACSTTARRCGAAVVMFVAFCLASSGTYYWNDILDLESDRNHPTKRTARSPAARSRSALGRVVGTVLLARRHRAGVRPPRWQAALVVVGYVVLTSLYSVVLKHIAVVDLVAVAAGFVLRAIAGAVAADVADEHVVPADDVVRLAVHRHRQAVRRAARARRQRARRGRRSRSTRSASCASCCRSAAARRWSPTASGRSTPQELAGTTWPFYELSIVPMVTALLRYMLILEQGHGAAPEEIFVHDRTLQVLGLIWVVVFGLGVYVVDERSASFDEVLAAVDGVDGWMSADQAQRLYDAAARPRRASRSSRSAASAGAARSCSRRAAPDGVEVVAIDPHAGNDRGPEEIEGFAAEAADDHEVFLANLAAAGVADRVAHVRAFSDARPREVDGTIEVLYIDGAHRYAPARSRHPRLGRARRRRRHDADPRLVLVGRRDPGDRRELVFGRRFRYVGRARR